MNRVLVGDIGSTSGDWALLSTQGSQYFSSSGFNPTAHQPSQFEGLAKTLLEQDCKDVIKIYYYGAGVNSQESRDVVNGLFEKVLPGAEVVVASDILGAARAVCQDSAGVVAILGTGSNACSYDGEQINASAVNLGYLLADEGGGYDIGKRLLRSYLYDQMPVHLAEKFKLMLPGGSAALVQHLYGHEAPNRFIASHAKFAIENRTDMYVKTIVRSAFQSFIHAHLIKYESLHKIHFVGSIASYFCGELGEVLAEARLALGEVIQKPIEGLANYHQRSKLWETQ